MKTNEIKTMCEGLGAAAAEVRENAINAKRLLLAAGEVMLAGEDLLTDDAVEELEGVTKYLAQHLAGSNGEGDQAEQQATEQIETEQLGAESLERIATQAESLESIATQVDKWGEVIIDECQQILDNYPPEMQRQLLNTMTERLPEKQQEWEDEKAFDDARDELLESIRELSPERIRMMAAAAKDNGDEVLAKKSA